jgi:Recombination, repair and ssDNA binding protein UvsY
MNLDTIFSYWGEDSKVDRSNLGEAALDISSLHHKYHKIYTNERLVLRSYESKLKTLKLQKYEFYTQGPTQETVDLGWKLPPSGKILKQEVANYMEADPEIIELGLKIGLQHEKVELLESIIKTITNRGFQIKTALDYMKFTMGE